MVPIWLDVLDETARLCVSHGRGDLAEVVEQKRALLLDPHLRVAVVGEPKQGKSELINALLNAPVCPVGEGVTTVVPTLIKHAGQPSAEAVHAERSVPVTFDEVATAIAGRSGAQRVEVGLPRGILESGMVVIDTPGFGQHNAAQTGSLVNFADVVLMVSDATRELSTSELELLLQLKQFHSRVTVVLTKTDLSPHWRAIAERDRQHLAGVGVPAALLPVSAALRLQAARSGDPVTNVESGFPELIAHLKLSERSKSDELARASVSLVAMRIVEQLATPLKVESAGAGSANALSRLHEAQRAVDDLRRFSMRWQNTLNDEMADLMADLEYDLHDRTRKILRNVDSALDKADPLDNWDAFAEWLEENLIEAAEANYGWMVQRCEAISRRVARHFTGYGYGLEALPGWGVRVPDDIADRIPVIDAPDVEGFSPTQKVFTGLRGSYGGLLMVGLATSLAGMPLVNAISVGAGMLFGGKTVLDESKSHLKRRQSQAKAAAQRYIDDFFLQFTKDCRDIVRQMHRRQRDHFTALGEEVQEALVQSFRRAKQAADADATQRDQRSRQIEIEMRRLATLYDHARALAAGQVRLASAT